MYHDILCAIYYDIALKILSFEDKFKPFFYIRLIWKYKSYSASNNYI